MAVAFDAGTTDKITVPNPQTLGSGSAFTFYQWFRRTAALSNSAGVGTNKIGTGFFDILVWLPFGLNVYSAFAPRATVNSERWTADDVLALNTWSFQATTYSEANGARIFYGRLNSPVIEAAYSTDTTGSGATSADAGDLIINNRGTSSVASIGGDLAVAAWYDREFSLQELISHQWKPRVASGCQMFYIPFATGTIPDLSGNVRNGTGTGLALANHVPLAQPFGQTSEWRGAANAATNNFTQNLAGGLTPAGAVSRAASISRGGGLTPAAILRRSVIVIRNGVIVPGGALQKSTMITRGGLIVPSAAAQNTPSKSLAGSATPAGSLRSDIAKALSGGITPGGTIETLKVALKDLAGSITASGTLTRAAAIVRSGSLSPSGILQKFAAIFRGGSATPAGSVDQSGGVSLDVGGSLTPAGLLTRSISQRLIGSLTPAAIVQKFVAMVRGGSMAPAGSAASSRVLTRIFSGTIASTGAIARSVGKVLSGQTTAAGTLSRSIGKVLGGLVQLAGSLISSFLGNFTSGSVRIYDFESTRLELAETSGVETRDLPSVRLSIDDFIAV